MHMHREPQTMQQAPMQGDVLPQVLSFLELCAHDLHAQGVMSRQYFGTDGIRGTVGQPPITPDFMLRLGHAVGRVLRRTRTGRRC
jgi:phosphomannomutase